MRLILGGAALVAALSLGLYLRLDRPAPDLSALAAGDPVRGEAVFWAGGCASCHAAGDEDKTALAGGQRFETPYGTFIAPNISPDPVAGIGAWDSETFLTAMQHGRRPDGLPYYPAFPYTAYALADPQDMVDLFAYLQTLPAQDRPSEAHELRFPYNIRPGLYLWQALYQGRGYAVTGDLTQEVARGRYLVEALAHCGECHTPRAITGALDYEAWLTGAPNPTGQGRIPALTPDRLTWSQADIAAYLRDGFTPSFDSAGGHMRDVILNMARLPEADRAAIAAYLKALP